MPIITSETAGNPTGGLKQATEYAQQIDFGADLDMAKLASIPGGQIHVTFSDRAGNSLSDLDLGAFGASAGNLRRWPEFPPRDPHL